MSEEKKWIVDIRFTIKAKEDWLASVKLMEFLPNGNEDVEYTILSTIRELVKG